MSAEQKRHGYLFNYKGPSRRERRGATSQGASSSSVLQKRKAADLAEMAKALFRANPLHDLESLLLIAIYFLLARVPAAYLKNVDEDLLRRVLMQKRFFERLFVKGELRAELLTNPDNFGSEFLAVLDPSLVSAGEELLEIAQILSSIYLDVESFTPPQERDFFGTVLKENVHGQISTIFKNIHDMFEEEDVEVARLDHPKLYVGTTTTPPALNEDEAPDDQDEFDENEQGETDDEADEAEDGEEVNEEDDE